MMKIIDCYWERVNLYLVCDKKINRNVYLMKKEEKIKLPIIDKEIIINVTNTPEGEMLSSGKWYLLYDEELLTLDSTLLKKMDDLSRIFPYRAEKCAYLVRLGIDNDENFVIKTDFMIKNRKWKHFWLLAEGYTISKKIIIVLKKLYLIFINIYYYFVRLFKFNKKKNVLFLTENSDELVGNLKFLYESIPSGKVNKKYFAMDNFIPENRTFFKRVFKYLKEIYLIAISDIIFVDNYIPKITHLKLSKKCRLVQLWHAGVGFKSVGYARFGLTGSPHPYWSCHRHYTDAIVDQENLIAVYKEVFGNKTEIFKAIGMPRLDGYLNKATIESVTEKLKKVNPKFDIAKVILFSPTYRGRGSADAYYDYSLLDLDKIYQFCKKHNFIFVIKMHPFVKEDIIIPKKYSAYIFDYSKYDINELIYVSDIMITDYSSCAYEFSLFDRPLIFYRFDKELYEYLRPMHSLDIFTSKQFEVRTFDELMNVLETNKNVKIEERYKNIKRRDNGSCATIIKEFIGD